MKEAVQTFSGFAGEKQAHNDINISLYRHRSDVPLSGKCALCGKSSRSREP
ncbi:hypothetical protein [Sinorhizobium meliloti]|jgi:hypothetical protein|uniref:hypothetical protein n=1 Tax=Rhizobium meliloti TaxID=382 RepID=UPI0012BCC239|nr:hypothetical protein [Sinorhizobium meliloti]MDX0104485.1 hypothetical protein [Sinorhizobium meliloti]MDX0140050.1 hypothetical protein [Sinorhizobium meliloti]MDX0383443.1 hypothetical protein [Sinorhizobium meliloti]UFX08377.1 hypothetical protein SmelRRI128_00220 [Sinorhizobium meliloti]